MENSHIEWTNHTFNGWIGCTKVSPGCAHCYAEARDIRFNDGIHWGKGAQRRRTADSNWREPIRWNAAQDTLILRAGMQSDRTIAHQIKSGELPIKRPRVFSASLSDWLDDEVPIAWLADLLTLIRATPNLDWLLLSKRPQNWQSRISIACLLLGQRGEAGDDEATQAFIMVDEWLSGVIAPANVWVGTTVEDQTRADERIPILLSIPAKIHFLSCEPLLGPVELNKVHDGTWLYAPLQGERVMNANGASYESTSKIDWVICGGESGREARPMNPSWARSLRDQCSESGVPFFFKQWGEFIPLFDATASPRYEFPDGERVFRVGKKSAGAVIDGAEHKAFPA